MDWSNDTCPVCNNGGREALPRMGDFAEFICDGCGRYRVTGTALEIIRHEEPQTRRAALDKAIERSSRDRSIPKITYDDLRGGVDGGGG